MHLQQPLGSCVPMFIYSFVLAISYYLLLYILCTRLPAFSATFSGSFCLATHAFLWSACIYMCECRRQCFSAPTAFTASDWSWMGIGKKKKEATQPASLHQSWQLLLFHITRSPLVPIFIATHLSPCHHICLHPPANYTSPFPQTTLISSDVFSACVGIRNINGG